MTSPTTAPDSSLAGTRERLIILALFLGAFIMGSAELLVVGVLDLVVEDLGTSIQTAGWLVTTYALGISVGGPALTALTMRLGRRAVLVGALAAYVAGSVWAALSPDMSSLLASRLVTGALHGLFIGVAFSVVGALVPPERMGRAIAAVFGGIAVATALGVPAGTAIGHALGWRAGFLAIVVTGALALLISLVVIPSVPHSGTGGLRAQARYAFAPRVLAVLGVGLLVMGGQFAALTYLAVYLSDITRVSGAAVSWFLLAYGAANAVGTFAGGWAADRAPARTIVIASAVLVAALATLYSAGANPAVVLVVLLVWGLVGFGLVPSLQYRVTMLAGPGADLAGVLPASAVTAGIAVGAVIGGRAVASAGVDAAVLVSAIICGLGVLAAAATSLLRPVEASRPVASRGLDAEPVATEGGA
ncbi:MFS transporter [Kribbella sancticallisti]|uniref:MFS transporter n=1 Tax=Kribbella sancticallisti TaxID=460087 RepID=A0ABP4PIV8_9ACTN